VKEILALKKMVHGQEVKMYSADSGRTLFMRKEDLREWQRRRLGERLLEGQNGNKAATGD
jgi:hypothetical protein